MRTQSESESNQSGVGPEPSGRASPRLWLIISIFIVLAVAGVILAKSKASAVVASQVDAFIEEAELNSGGSLEVDYEDVEAVWFGSGLRIAGITTYSIAANRVESIAVGILRLDIEGREDENSLPRSMTIGLKDISLKDQQINNQVLASTGIDYTDRKIDIHGHYDFTSDEEGTLKVRGSVAVSELNKIGFTLHITGIEDAWTELEDAYRANANALDLTPAQSRSLSQALAKSYLKSMTITYENMGEIEHFMRQAAQESGLPVDELKKILAASVTETIGNTQLAGEVAKFIEKPERLELSVLPKEPIAVSDLSMIMMGISMGRYQAVMAQMNVQIKAN